MNILVTGATGFVGRHLCQILVDGGHTVQATARSAVVFPRQSDSITYHVVDTLTAATDWQPFLEGVNAIVHLAALVHQMSPKVAREDDYYQSNTMATARLAEQAAAAGVQKFIFLSTIKVNGERTLDHPFSPSDVPHPEDDYGISKLQAERQLFEIASLSRIKAVAIRSPLVYGSGVRANFLRLLWMIDRGLPLPLGAIRNTRSLVSVWNLCDLIRTAIEAPLLQSGVLMVSDGEGMSTPDLIRRIARQMNRPARLFPVPMALLRAIGEFTGKGKEVSRLCDSLMVDISATRQGLNWVPPVSIDESLGRTVQWYLREHKTNAN